MIRIKPRRCGYGGEKGYTCQRLPQLQDWMFNEEIPFIAQMKAEFNKLPLRVKGMVYTEETIDMGWSEFGPHPEVPELTCRSNTDPASDTTDVSVWGATGIPVEVGNATAYPVYGGSSGWLDLFNSGYEITGGTQYFYHNISGTTAATSDVYIKVTGVDHEYHDIYLVGNIPTFKNGEQEMEMGPGLLEPMLDTDFAPVGIDTIPAWEAGLDADIFTNIVLNAWKGVIDDRIRNIYARLNNIPVAATDYNLRDLKREEYENTDCQNFRINLSIGESLQTRDNQVTNTYTVTDGQVAVDDYSVYVSGDVFTVEPAMDYPIYVWVRVYETEGSGTTTTAEIVLLDDSYSIGDELSGGEVIAKEQISVPGSVYRYKYTVQFDDGRKYTGLLFFGFPLPDADDHVVVVGGVRKVFGGTSNDSFVLFKIFQTECSPVMNFASDAEMGLHGVIDFDIDGNEIITPLPGSTITPAPGIVQPAVNIALVVNGSTETNTQSTTDVPTVEAVYNFIHGITVYNGPVADAKATEIELSGISGSTVFGEPVDYVIPINKDRWAQNTEDEISGYTAAASMYEAAKAAWELAGEPTEGEIYEAYIEASTVYSDAYYTVYGDVSDGEPGTTYVINNIVLMNGDMMGVAATTAPSVRAVYNFVHDIYALSTVGTILVNEQNIPYVSHGTPGTVFTVDSLDKARYEAEEYYQDEVPTVKAVMDYVEGKTVSDASAGYIAINSRQSAETIYDIAGSTAEKGLVQTVGNVWKAVIPTLSTQVVPTVVAVIDFVHNYDLAETEGSAHNPVARAIATEGTIVGIDGTTTAKITGHTVDESVQEAVPGTCYTVDSMLALRNSELIHTYVVGETASYTTESIVPTVEAVRDYVDNYLPTAGTISVTSTTDEWIHGETVHAGVVEVSTNVNAHTDPEKRGISKTAVPTVEAVYDFVLGHTTTVISATAGTIQISGQTEKWADPPAQQPAQGTVFVSTEVRVAEEPSLSLEAVPTVKAVSDFVSGYTAHIGGFTVSGTAEQWLEGQTAQAGIFGVVDTIEAATLPTGTRTLSTTNVPTVAAVKDYVDKHTPASATVGTIEIDGDNDEIWVDGYTSTAGIVQVSSNIEVDTIPEERVISAIAVPTVEAVYTYVNKFLGGSTAGYLAYDGYSHDIIVDAIVGGATVSQNIYVHREGAVSGDSAQVVPTVEAVYNFIHGTTTYIDGVALELSDAKATVGTVGATTPPGEVVTGVTTSGCTPGTYNVVSNIVGATNTSTGAVSSVNDAVPTVKAVVEYIDDLDIEVTASTAGTLIIKGTTAVWSDSDVAVAGIVEVSKNVITGNTPSASMWSVPTVDAVYAFVHCPETSNRYRALALARTISAPSEGSTVATFAADGKPGTCYVCTDMRGLSGEDVTLDTSYVVDGKACTLACVVPTVQAVKTYVAENAPDATYNGPFAVSGGTINGGDAYFDGVWKATAGPYTGALEDGTTYWCVLTKTGSNYAAAIRKTSSTSVYEAAVPVVAIDANGVITQLHYGAVNIQGRWN